MFEWINCDRESGEQIITQEACKCYWIIFVVLHSVSLVSIGSFKIPTYLICLFYVQLQLLDFTLSLPHERTKRAPSRRTKNLISAKSKLQQQLAGELPFSNSTSEDFKLEVCTGNYYCIPRFKYQKRVSVMYFVQTFVDSLTIKGRGVLTQELIPANVYVVTYWCLIMVTG